MNAAACFSPGQIWMAGRSMTSICGALSEKFCGSETGSDESPHLSPTNARLPRVVDPLLNPHTKKAPEIQGL